MVVWLRGCVQVLRGQHVLQLESVIDITQPIVAEAEREDDEPVAVVADDAKDGYEIELPATRAEQQRERQERHGRVAGGAMGSLRTLKLLLTDGQQDVVGVEVVPCPKLSTSLSVGVKLAVRDVMVVRGHLLLTPDNTRLLGGGLAAAAAAQPQTSSASSTGPPGAAAER